MATYTENLNLKKPNQEDFFNIEDFNNNADIIDSAMEGKANKINNGTEGNLVSIGENGDIEDSGVNVNQLAMWEDLEDYIQNIGGYKKYTTPGTHTFRVPFGITSVKVSMIGGGGGGGGGGAGYYDGGCGGGGGGRGEYVIDQTVEVTSHEMLTIIIGSSGVGGAGGSSSSSDANGKSGTSGTDTSLKRGETIIKKVAAGTNGTGGTEDNGYYGRGGDIGGANGSYPADHYREKGGYGGTGGKITYFGVFGDGGDGGTGGNYKGDSSYRIPGQSGSAGGNGAMVICFGGCDFSSIAW